MFRACALLLFSISIARAAPAQDAVDVFRKLVAAEDCKVDDVKAALKPLVDDGVAAALPPIEEGLDRFEKSYEASAIAVARASKTGGDGARASELLLLLRKGSLDLVDAYAKKGDPAGVNLVLQAYERTAQKVADLERQDEKGRGKLADLSAKVYELEQKKADAEEVTRVSLDKAEQTVRVDQTTQTLEHRRDLRLRLAKAGGAVLANAKGPDAEKTLALLNKKVDSKAPPEDRILWIDLYARLGRETTPAELLDVAQTAARQWKVHEDEVDKLRDKYEKAKAAYMKSVDLRTNTVNAATQAAFNQLQAQIQKATSAQRDMDRLRLTAARAMGASVAAVAEAKRDKLVDWALGAAANEKEIETRCALIESLGQLDTPKVRDSLRKMLVNDKEVRARLEALEALTQLKDADGMEIARARLLAHDNWRVRAAAVAALARVPEKASITALVAALETEVGRVREDVTQALQRLTGQTFAMSFPVWKKWWDENQATFKFEDVPAAKKLAVSAWDQAGSGKVTFYGISSISKHVCFVIDVSRSMMEPASDKGDKRKIDVAKEQLKQAIDGLSDGDTFMIIAFAESVQRWQPKMTKVDAAAKERVKKWIDDKLELGPGTNIHAGMKTAFETAGLGSRDSAYQSEIDTIFFMTDGEPTVGEVTDPLELRRLIREWNRLSRIRIHCIGVGKDPNIALLFGIAEDAGGQFQHR